MRSWTEEARLGLRDLCRKHSVKFDVAMTELPSSPDDLTHRLLFHKGRAFATLQTRHSVHFSLPLPPYCGLGL